MADSDAVTLSQEQVSRFDALVARVGFDRQAVSAYGKLSRKVTVGSLAELRDLIGTPDDAMRAGSVVNVPRSGADADPEQASFDHAMRYLYGDGSMNSDEVASLENRFFPLEVKVVVDEDKTIPAGETWVISNGGGPEVHHYRTVTMKPGSKIEIFGALLTFTCQRFTREG